MIMSIILVVAPIVVFIFHILKRLELLLSIIINRTSIEVRKFSHELHLYVAK
jgi:hypothetical protein